MSIAFLLLILSANRVKPAQTSYSDLTPSEVSKDVFPAQIQQICKTTEAPRAGNNLNIIAAPQTSNSRQDGNHFQPISTIYSFENEQSEKKYEDEKFDLLPSFERNQTEIVTSTENSDLKDDLVIPEAGFLVWNDCMETKFRENYLNLLKAQHNMEDGNQNEKKNGVAFNDGINKRDINITNDDRNSTALRAWKQKYNELKELKDEKRRQMKMDLIMEAKLSTTTKSPVKIPIIPVTVEIYEDPTEYLSPKLHDSNSSENNKSYTEDWYEEEDRNKIRFGKLPQSNSYRVPKLKLDEGFYPFEFMWKFFAVIYPYDFPVELIKEIVWGEFAFPYSFLHSITVESTFLVFILIFSFIALVIPSYLLVLGILALMSRASRDDDVETGALFPDDEGTNCSDRVLVMFTLFVVLLCCASITGMELSNEQAHTAALETRDVISCACADLATWLATSARELHHSLVPPADLVVHAYDQDLNNVENLLGEPIQEAITSESGIDLVLDSLADIVTECEDLSIKISSLRDIGAKAGSLSQAASDRIRDLSQQIDNLKKHCTSKDMPLCDTISFTSLEIKINFDSILHEHQLTELRVLGVDNLTRAIAAARLEISSLPSAIATQTQQIRADILRDMESRRQTVHNSAQILTNIVRHLTGGLHSVVRSAEAGLARMQGYEFWRWVALLSSATLFGFIMFLILTAMMCGCGRAKNHARNTLQVSTVWICFAYLGLWTVVSVIFLIAGHAEIYVCHALRDYPQYRTLSALLDKPSPLLDNQEGIIQAVFRELENVSIDVSVVDILRDCEKDQPSYTVFQLDKLLDVDKLTSYQEWDELKGDMKKLSSFLDIRFLKTISFSFNKLLTQMLAISDIKLAKYRMEYNGAVVGRDIPSLIDQMENVAAQVTDLNTAGRLQTLASRAHRLHTNSIKPLEQLRADLVYKLTELELQLLPFRRKLNISLSHIHTAQYYIDNQGETIAQKKVSTYVTRLTNHAADWRNHVLSTTQTQAARCGPLYMVYSAVRTQLCTRYVSSLHGWWVCGFFLGLLWCTALTPLLVKLWRNYGRRYRSREAMSLTNLTGQHGTPTTALCEGSHWNTPGPPPTPPPPAPPGSSDSW